MIHFKDNKNKSALSTRWAQMSKQEQVIEQKKNEIQAKLEAQKQAAALAAQAKLSNPNTVDDTGSANIFSNDGSFMSQYKALLEKQKKEQLIKDQKEKKEEEKKTKEEETLPEVSHDEKKDKDHYSHNDEKRRPSDRMQKEKNRRWNDRGRNRALSPTKHMTEDRNNLVENKNPPQIPSLMQIPVMPPDDNSNDSEKNQWNTQAPESEDNDSNLQDNIMGPGPMQNFMGPGVQGQSMMGPGALMPPMPPGAMGPGSMMGSGGPPMPPIPPGSMPPMPPFMGGPPNFPMPPNLMGPNGPRGPGPMPPNMCGPGPNGPMPPFFGPPFHNPSMMGPNSRPHSMMGPNGPNSMMRPNGPPNSMMGPNGPPNSMMGPNGPPNSMMGPNGPPNSMMGPNGPPNSMMGPNGPPNSMMGPNGPPNSMIRPNGPPNSIMGPNGPNSIMGQNGPPNLIMGPSGPLNPIMGSSRPPNSIIGAGGRSNLMMGPSGPPGSSGFSDVMIGPNGPPNSILGPNGLPNSINSNMSFMPSPFGSSGPNDSNSPNFGDGNGLPMPFMPPNSMSLNKVPEPQRLETMSPAEQMNHQNNPPPLPPNHLAKSKDYDTGMLSSQVLTDSLPPPVQRAAAEVACNGDQWENVLKAIHSQDQNMWFLHNTNSNEYKAFRELVNKIRREGPPEGNTAEVKPEDKYEPEFSLEDDESNDGSKPYVKQENKDGTDYNNQNMQSQSMKKEQEDTQSDEEPESKRDRRKRKKSRWGDEPPPADIKPPGIIAPLPPGMMPGVQLAKIDEEGLKLTTVNRNNQALMQYALTNYGTTNLNAEDWKKCEDNFKLNLLYQDMLKKRQQVERLAAAGKHKYEYDSDEDTAEGTWEHKLRTKEMFATEKWAEELTKQAAGKHHIGDFLPPEELKKFMEKYSAVKSGKEPDLSDYKEYKLKEDNVGFKMLQKLGWTEGQGLGAEGTGIVDPINKATQPAANMGLGAGSGAVSPEDDEFDAYRKRMMLAYRFRPNPLNNPRRPYY